MPAVPADAPCTPSESHLKALHQKHDAGTRVRHLAADLLSPAQRNSEVRHPSPHSMCRAPVCPGLRPSCSAHAGSLKRQPSPLPLRTAEDKKATWGLSHCHVPTGSSLRLVTPTRPAAARRPPAPSGPPRLASLSPGPVPIHAWRLCSRVTHPSPHTRLSPLLPAEALTPPQRGPGPAHVPHRSPGPASARPAQP